MARRSIELDRGLFEADQRDEAAKEAVRFLEAVELVDHSTVEQAEIAGSSWDRDVGRLVDHAITDFGHHAFDQRLTRALAALGVNNVVAVAPLREHLDE